MYYVACVRSLVEFGLGTCLPGAAIDTCAAIWLSEASLRPMACSIRRHHRRRRRLPQVLLAAQSSIIAAIQARLAKAEKTATA